MATMGAAKNREKRDRPPLFLGGYVALGESAWMGIAQATEFLESLRLAGSRLREALPRLRQVTLRDIFTRKFSMVESEHEF